MGGAAGEETRKALRIAATDGDGASTRASVAPAEQQRPAPLLPAAAGTDGGSVSVQRCGEDDDDEEEEKVERFYALLANIRALRGLCSAGESGRPAAGRGRKRAREAEAPWRPAFRMEDFEDEVSQGTADDARCAVKNWGANGAGVVARRPAAAAADQEDEHEVAEARGKKLGRRVAARG